MWNPRKGQPPRDDGEVYPRGTGRLFDDWWAWLVIVGIFVGAVVIGEWLR